MYEKYLINKRGHPLKPAIQIPGKKKESLFHESIFFIERRKTVMQTNRRDFDKKNPLPLSYDQTIEEPHRQAIYYIFRNNFCHESSIWYSKCFGLGSYRLLSCLVFCLVQILSPL